ncbi:MAG: phosphonopyruvate decarboxylase [Rhodospirillaceae bacterium]|jgi:sulfopyruvate decarboxylase alpha subunit|nr:phosphonopyruvate decarboxylase [Rhodospirillaceae bacterium]MBT3884621.1 phosphonopyruvate decarboxylase [Rhodospirillaceae bacterium]MBT4117493.1 phosphonopyruvate decarboxylase [Rhodospirillaceae bacterium]MBT4672075.1 phosphonopyruvate decarboxylase [Rhodospirillaceae bacterium]MBT4719637.1 phosphonopyruvate decarboxylase [Rhodospirillaceae bacterium]
MNWWQDIFGAFKANDVAMVAYVPDAGHSALIEACVADNEIRAVPLTTEEEGVALLAGAWLGGAKGVLLMQSSGVGNCINMLSLAATCRFPLPLFVTMRGQWHEFNPWQFPMGQTAEAQLNTAAVETMTAAAAEDVAPMAAATLDMAYSGGGMAALLLHQSLSPVKTFDQGGGK